MNVFSPLENVIIVKGIDRPFTARFVGKSVRSYTFERLTVNGKQHKKSKLHFIVSFHFGDEKIMGKRVVVID